MSRRRLTKKQLDFYTYLKSYLETSGGLWPTYREIVDHFDFRSPNSVTQNLQALLKKGFLRRDENGYQFTERSLTRNGQASIPITGVITAGHLQEAVEANLGSITLETIFPNLDRIFAIRVAGHSMVGADINDGDYVLLMDDDIPNGGIGAVLYNGETSLKRIFQTDRGLRLEPANDDYPDIHIEPGIFEEVRLLGRYVGHMNTSGVYKAAS
jgi:repressor LexA